MILARDKSRSGKALERSGCEVGEGGGKGFTCIARQGLQGLQGCLEPF